MIPVSEQCGKIIYFLTLADINIYQPSIYFAAHNVCILHMTLVFTFSDNAAVKQLKVYGRSLWGSLYKVHLNAYKKLSMSELKLQPWTTSGVNFRVYKMHMNAPWSCPCGNKPQTQTKRDSGSVHDTKSSGDPQHCFSFHEPSETSCSRPNLFTLLMFLIVDPVGHECFVQSIFI